MSWIKTISYKDANKVLKRVYDKVKGPNNNIDNILKIHSLRPHTLNGHMVLYKNTIHNANNTLPKWYLETIGVYVSLLNKCNYCIVHHYTGLKRLLNDDAKAEKLLKSLKNDEPNHYFDDKYCLGLTYAKKLTLEAKNILKTNIIALRTVGFTDGEILEINQVTSYFNYANRTVLGLGVNLKGDILGLSPSEQNDANNWNHQ